MATETGYVQWNNKDVEPVIEDEQGKIEELQQIFKRMQEKNFSHHRHAFRGTHVKTQAIVKGTLTVSPNLSGRLAQGIFAHPGKKYDVAVRYANEPSFLQDDKEKAPRGLGMKVFGVDEPESAWLDDSGEKTHVQDFTFNNAPSLELTDLPTAVEIIRLREQNFDSPTMLTAQLALRSDRLTQFAPYHLPNVHPIGMVMFSQSAYRYGDYVVKHALFPSTELQQKLAEQKVPSDAEPEVLSQWLTEFFHEHDAEYDFRVQFCRDLSKQSVEDCSKEWSEKDAPFETVGKLVLPKGQESFDPKRRTFWEDNLKLNVWYGLKAHQPLGSANRVRKNLYKSSQAFRGQMNATEVKYIKDISEIP